jgi:hypothetical protein
VRLADEGVPVRAIARCLKIPSEEVREMLDDAVQSGDLLAVPKDDWPPWIVREDREPLPALMKPFDEDALIMHTGFCFGLSRMQGAVLLQFLRRREVTRELLHMTLEAHRPPNENGGNTKIVDVVLWAIRRKLKPYFDDHRVIVTVVAQGYLMIPEYRQRAMDMLSEHLRMPWRQPH